MAGRAGVEPWNFTFGELNAMADAKERSEWERTSWVLAMLHNINVSKKHHQKPPSKFNPMAHDRSGTKKLTPKQSIAVLKSAFIKGS